jgi:hypothetical protein
MVPIRQSGRLGNTNSEIHLRLRSSRILARPRPCLIRSRQAEIEHAIVKDTRRDLSKLDALDSIGMVRRLVPIILANVGSGQLRPSM